MHVLLIAQIQAKLVVSGSGSVLEAEARRATAITAPPAVRSAPATGAATGRTMGLAAEAIARAIWTAILAPGSLWLGTGLELGLRLRLESGEDQFQ